MGGRPLYISVRGGGTPPPRSPDISTKRLLSDHNSTRQEVKGLYNKVKTLRKELKELCNEISYKRRIYIIDDIKEIKEEAIKSKHRRIEIQEYNNKVSIIFS
jgi:KaiC/GvpD/RAD55 family RecA-like ATPase